MPFDGVTYLCCTDCGEFVVIGRAIQPDGDQPGRLGFLSLRESGLVVFE